HVSQLRLRLAQGLLGPLALGDVPGNAAVAGKPARGIQHRLAADGHKAKRTVDALDLVDEVAERLAALHSGHVLAPMFRLRREIGGDIPAAPPDQRAPINTKAGLRRDIGKGMVRASGPEPVRRRLGIVAEPLFALLEVTIGALQIPTHALEGRNDLVELVLLLGRAPLQAQWWRWLAQIVLSEKSGQGGQVPRDKPVSDRENKKGDEENRRALADQDDDRLMEEGAIDLVKCGFNQQHTKLFLLAARRMDKREGAAHSGMGLTVTAAHHQRIGAIGGLAHFDEA